MARVIPSRMTVEIDGDFVVFLIGMRINKPWKVHKWLPVALAMPRMIKELEAHPDSGFLGHIASLGLIVQYWRSFEHLESYARNENRQHWPAWTAFNKRVGNSRGDVGIWHETYQARAGEYETVYRNAALRSREGGQTGSGERQTRFSQGTIRPSRITRAGKRRFERRAGSNIERMLHLKE